MDDTPEARISACLQSVVEVDEYVSGGLLTQWYAVAVFHLPDGRQCLTRYTPEAQPTWVDLGLLDFAREALTTGYFGPSDDDDEDE